MRAALEAYLHLLYPPACYHCEAPIIGSKVFCDACVDLLDLLHVEGRCVQCFSESPQQVCSICRKRHTIWKGAAAAFEYAGPPAALIKRLKYGRQPHLALSAAAFLVAQLENLQWPLPDVIVPVPMPFLRRVMRGYNQSLLIAQELGKFLNRPVLDILRRSSGDFAQAGLSFSQRQGLSPKRFHLRRPETIADRTVLLIDDVFTTGTTLHCCAEALLAGCPGDVYALTVCRA